jgi:hypothetical protein
MSNPCFYSMKVKGTKEDVEEFIKVIKADYNYDTMEFSFDRHLQRVFSAEEEDIEVIDSNTCSVFISGECAWSVVVCMLDDGYYVDMKARLGNKFRGTTLEIESERLNLDIEVFSEECGCCFQEHYVILHGVVEVEECVEWHEYFLDEYESKEEAEDELEIEITDAEWEEREMITRGGFGDWDFSI